MSDTDISTDILDAAVSHEAEPAATDARARSWFVKGNKGGPGRPPGARNKASLVLDELAAGEAEAVFGQVAKAARAGDLRAAELILSRLWPRNRTVCTFELPPITMSDDLPAALAVITEALSQGDLAPADAIAAVAVVSAQCAALSKAEYHERNRRLFDPNRALNRGAVMGPNEGSGDGRG